MHNRDSENQRLLRRRAQQEHKQASKSTGSLLSKVTKSFRTKSPESNWKSSSFSLSETRSSRSSYASRSVTPAPRRKKTPTKTPRSSPSKKTHNVPDGRRPTNRPKNTTFTVTSTAFETPQFSLMNLWKSEPNLHGRPRNILTDGSTTTKHWFEHEDDPLLLDDDEMKSDYLDEPWPIRNPRELTPRPFGDREHTPSELDIVFPDTSIPPVPPQRPLRSRPSEPIAMGGTDLRPAFDLADEEQIHFAHGGSCSCQCGTTMSSSRHNEQNRRRNNDWTAWFVFILEIVIHLLCYILFWTFQLFQNMLPMLYDFSSYFPQLCHLTVEMTRFVWEVFLSLFGCHSWHERPSWRERAPDLYERSSLQHDMFVVDDGNVNSPRRSRRILKRERRLITTNAGKCLICLQRESNMALQDCGHVVSCGECSGSLRQCPICRVVIKSRPLFLRF